MEHWWVLFAAARWNLLQRCVQCCTLSLLVTAVVASRLPQSLIVYMKDNALSIRTRPLSGYESVKIWHKSEVQIVCLQKKENFQNKRPSDNLLRMSLTCIPDVKSSQISFANEVMQKNQTKQKIFLKEQFYAVKRLLYSFVPCPTVSVCVQLLWILYIERQWIVLLPQRLSVAQRAGFQKGQPLHHAVITLNLQVKLTQTTSISVCELHLSHCKLITVHQHCLWSPLRKAIKPASKQQWLGFSSAKAVTE